MQFDKTKYKVWTWKNPMMLHWVLNPGIALIECGLGQRAPKVVLVEKEGTKPLAEKSFIPCPHCHTIHSSMKWTPQNHTGFGNWFGLYCDNCGNTIPCLTNLTSYLLMGLSFPVWIWFKKSWKLKWLQSQKQKFARPLQLSPSKYNWVAEGLGWGFIMFMFSAILFPWYDDEKITYSTLGFSFIQWTIAGLFYGYLMKTVLFKNAGKQTPVKTQ